MDPTINEPLTIESMTSRLDNIVRTWKVHAEGKEFLVNATRSDEDDRHQIATIEDAIKPRQNSQFRGDQ